MARRLALVVSIALCALVLPGAVPPTVFTPGAPGSATPTTRSTGTAATTSSTTTWISPTTRIPTSPVRNGDHRGPRDPEPVGVQPRLHRADGPIPSRSTARARAWTRDGQELTIDPKTPASGTRRRSRWQSAYHGVPRTAPGTSAGPDSCHTDDGAIIVGEPHGAATWFPANDHPTDKASFTFHWTVPEGLEVVANGVPRARQQATAGRPGPGMLSIRWLPTWRRRPSASSTSTPTRRRASPTGMPLTRPCSSHRFRPDAHPADGWQIAALAGRQIRVVQAADAGHRGPGRRGDAVVRCIP